MPDGSTVGVWLACSIGATQTCIMLQSSLAWACPGQAQATLDGASDVGYTCHVLPSIALLACPDQAQAVSRQAKSAIDGATRHVYPMPMACPDKPPSAICCTLGLLRASLVSLPRLALSKSRQQ